MMLFVSVQLGDYITSSALLILLSMRDMPKHFHASPAQKEIYPELSKRVSVYAPAGSDCSILESKQRV